MRIARVFPRRTSATPDDELAFVGDPPLFLPTADEVHVSCTFTWDRPQAQRLARAWANHGYTVRIGGPAQRVGHPARGLEVGQRPAQPAVAVVHRRGEAGLYVLVLAGGVHRVVDQCSPRVVCPGDLVQLVGRLESVVLHGRGSLEPIRIIQHNDT